MHKWATLIITHYIFIITVIRLSSNPSTYKLFFLVLYSSGKIGTFHAWSNRTSKYFICFLTNILLRLEGFTEQSFAIQNKFLSRTVLRSFLHKLERNLMQSLELASKEFKGIKSLHQT